LDSIERFTAGAPQYDDITCLIVRFSGAVNPAA
jgi:serine phosphatase RsbU (regulator of sigma subunit)